MLIFLFSKARISNFVKIFFKYFFMHRETILEENFTLKWVLIIQKWNLLVFCPIKERESRYKCSPFINDCSKLGLLYTGCYIFLNCCKYSNYVWKQPFTGALDPVGNFIKVKNKNLNAEAYWWFHYTQSVYTSMCWPLRKTGCCKNNLCGVLFQ